MVVAEEEMERTHMAAGEDGNDNSESVGGYLSLGVILGDIRHAEKMSHSLLSCNPHHLPKFWLLLDSCSSSNIISTKRLLHNIHQAKTTLCVNCRKCSA